MLGYSGAEGVSQSVDDVDREGVYPGRRSVRFLVEIELLAPKKVNIDHLVAPGCVGPHRGKYLADGSHILIHRALPYRVALCG